MALKLAKYQPELTERQRKISIRLNAYTALQAKRKAAQEGTIEALDATTLEAAEHGEQLETCDDQKRALREKGHFFFVHPHAKKDQFPVVDNPDGRIDTYTYEMPAEQKNVPHVSKSFYKKINHVKKVNKHRQMKHML